MAIIRLLTRFRCDKCGIKEDTELALPLGWIEIKIVRPKPIITNLPNLGELFPECSSFSLTFLSAQLKMIQLQSELDSSSKTIHACKKCCKEAKNSLGLS